MAEIMASDAPEPEEIQVRESVRALLDYDERAYADRKAAERSVIRRLVALGWDARRAYAAVAYESDND